VDLLVAAGLLDQSSAAYDGDVSVSERGANSPVADAARVANERSPDLVVFLVDGLWKIPVGGAQGLKARTALLEYRYDEA
jgi:hypothetical protein